MKGAAVMACGLALGVAGAQTDLPPAPSAVLRTAALQLPDGVVVKRETAGAIPLKLDDAIAIGSKGNAQVIIQGDQEKLVRGSILTAENALLPTVALKAYTQAQEINLAALGLQAPACWPASTSRRSTGHHDSAPS